MSQQEYWNAYWKNACDTIQFVRFLRRVLSINIVECQRYSNHVVYKIRVILLCIVCRINASFPKLSNFCFDWLVVKWCGKEVQFVKRLKVIWVHNHKLCGNTSSKNLPSKQAKALFEWRINKKRLKWTKKIIRTRGGSLVQLKWTKETITTWRTSLVHQQ